MADVYQTQYYLLADGAPRHDAWTLHVQMCFGKALRCATVRTLSYCCRNIRSKYFAQFTSGSVAVEVVVSM
jgi:hypothetical protein